MPNNNTPTTTKPPDIHNRIDETSPGASFCTDKLKAAGSCLGGWARVGAAVNAARAAAKKDGAAFLYLDAGDQLDGSLWDVVYKGMATAEILNAVKPDAMVRRLPQFVCGAVLRSVGAVRCVWGIVGGWRRAPSALSFHTHTLLNSHPQPLPLFSLSAGRRLGNDAQTLG